MSAELKLIKEQRPQLKEITLRTYQSSLKRLKKISETYELEPLKKYLLGLENPALARNLLTPLMIIHHRKFEELFNQLQRAADEIRLNQLPSKSQVKNLTTLKEVNRMLRRMREDIRTHKLLDRNYFTLNTVQRRLVLAYVSFTLLLDVTMRNDCNTLQLATTTSKTTNKGNWYVHSTGTVVLREFKTARAFRNRGLLPLYIAVQPKTRKVISRFLHSRQLQGRYLFCLTPDQQLTKTQHATILTAHSYRYLGVRLGTTMLRHLVLSQFERTNPTLKSRKEKMRRMQQLLVETQMSYAWVGNDS